MTKLKSEIRLRCPVCGRDELRLQGFQWGHGDWGSAEGGVMGTVARAAVPHADPPLCKGPFHRVTISCEACGGEPRLLTFAEHEGRLSLSLTWMDEEGSGLLWPQRGLE